MKHLVIFGAPGSGKGTQSKKLEEKLDFKVFSTGDLVRAEIASGSELGKTCSEIIMQGKLVGNDIVYPLVEKFLTENSEAVGVLYDGFPRTVEQAEFLLNILKQRNETIQHVINVRVDEDLLIKRISGRFSCAKCGEIYNKYFKTPAIEGVCDICGSDNFKIRTDDTEEIIKNRLVVYNETTAPILDFFIDQRLNLIDIDGMQSVDNVFHQIENVL